MTQECAEYRALYEKIVLPADVGPRVDWARVLEQKQVRVILSVRAASGSSKLTPDPIRNPRAVCPQGPAERLPLGGAGKGERPGDRAAREGFLQEGACEEVGGFS